MSTEKFADLLATKVRENVGSTEPTDSTEPTEQPTGEADTAPSDDTVDNGDNAPTEPLEQPTGEEDADAGDVKKLTAEVEKWKAQSRKHEARAKRAPTATKELEELRAKVANYEREALVSEIANKGNIPDDMRSLLTGATEEELEAQVKLISEFTAKPAEDKPKPPTNPFQGVLGKSQKRTGTSLLSAEFAKQIRSRN